MENYKKLAQETVNAACQEAVATLRDEYLDEGKRLAHQQAYDSAREPVITCTITAYPNQPDSNSFCFVELVQVFPSGMEWKGGTLISLQRLERCSEDFIESCELEQDLDELSAGKSPEQE